MTGDLYLALVPVIGQLLLLDRLDIRLVALRLGGGVGGAAAAVVHLNNHLISSRSSTVTHDR